LWLVEGISIAVATLLLVWGRNGGSVQIERWQLGLLILPWVFMFLAGAPLAYLSWFRHASPGATTMLRRWLYWLFILTIGTILLAIYGIFVF
jgi:hypothetical protein